MLSTCKSRTRQSVLLDDQKTTSAREPAWVGGSIFSLLQQKIQVQKLSMEEIERFLSELSGDVRIDSVSVAVTNSVTPAPTTKNQVRKLFSWNTPNGPEHMGVFYDGGDNPQIKMPFPKMLSIEGLIWNNEVGRFEMTALDYSLDPSQKDATHAGSPRLACQACHTSGVPHFDSTRFKQDATMISGSEADFRGILYKSEIQANFRGVCAVNCKDDIKCQKKLIVSAFSNKEDPLSEMSKSMTNELFLYARSFTPYSDPFSQRFGGKYVDRVSSIKDSRFFDPGNVAKLGAWALTPVKSFDGKTAIEVSRLGAALACAGFLVADGGIVANLQSDSVKLQGFLSYIDSMQKFDPFELRNELLRTTGEKLVSVPRSQETVDGEHLAERQKRVRKNLESLDITRSVPMSEATKNLLVKADTTCGICHGAFGLNRSFNAYDFKSLEAGYPQTGVEFHNRADAFWGGMGGAAHFGGTAYQLGKNSENVAQEFLVKAFNDSFSVEDIKIYDQSLNDVTTFLRRNPLDNTGRKPVAWP